MSIEIDPVTKTVLIDYLSSIIKKEYIKPLQFGDKPVRDLGNLLQAVEGEKLTEKQKQILNLFKDFLDKCLHLDPLKRMTPE